MAIAIIAGTALGALGHPTPLIDPSLELVATSYKETVTRKVRRMIRAKFQSLFLLLNRGRYTGPRP